MCPGKIYDILKRENSTFGRFPECLFWKRGDSPVYFKTERGESGKTEKRRGNTKKGCDSVGKKRRTKMKRLSEAEQELMMIIWEYEEPASKFQIEEKLDPQKEMTLITKDGIRELPLMGKDEVAGCLPDEIFFSFPG